jgi:hypothetical protein
MAFSAVGGRTASRCAWNRPQDTIFSWTSPEEYEWSVEQNLSRQERFGLGWIKQVVIDDSVYEQPHQDLKSLRSCSQIVSTSNGRCVSTGLPDGGVSRVRGLDKVK